VLVVDEAVAFTGGVGISDLWQGDARSADEWRDSHFRVRGACVDGLRAAFLDNWVEAGGALFEVGTDRFPEEPKAGTCVAQCVRGSSGPGKSDVATLLRTLIQVAGARVRVATAYFVPDEELLGALCDAASRGIEVQVLLPGPHADKRFVQLSGEASYETLLDHGIAMWNFQPSMLHTKIMTVDGIVSNIGSANFNARSTSCDEEVNLVVLDADLTATLDEQFDEDLERSVRITSARWKDRSLRQQAVESALTPLRRWF
jgi:cardiolipin synthase